MSGISGCVSGISGFVAVKDWNADLLGLFRIKNDFWDYDFLASAIMTVWGNVIKLRN